MEKDPRVFLETLPDCSSIQQKINDSYDSLFATDDLGRHVPFVCSVCDEILMRKREVEVTTVAKMKKCKSLLSWNWIPDTERLPEVERQHRFQN